MPSLPHPAPLHLHDQGLGRDPQKSRYATRRETQGPESLPGRLSEPDRSCLWPTAVNLYPYELETVLWPKKRTVHLFRTGVSFLVDTVTEVCSYWQSIIRLFPEFVVGGLQVVDGFTPSHWTLYLCMAEENVMAQGPAQYGACFLTDPLASHPKDVWAEKPDFHDLANRPKEYVPHKVTGLIRAGYPSGV